MVLLRLGTADVGAWLGLGLAGIFYNMFQQFLARRSSHPGAELVLDLLGVKFGAEVGLARAWLAYLIIIYNSNWLDGARTQAQNRG